MIKGLMGSLATDLFSDENRDELINEINEDVDIPLFNEKTEEKGIRKIVELTEKWLIK